MKATTPRRLLLPAVLAATFAAVAPAQDLLLRASRIVVAPDTVLDDAAVLVRQGKVAYVGADIPAEARAQARLVDYGDATVVPGFVLAVTTLGRDRDLAEGALAFTPDLRAVEAFDPWQKELLGLPAHGITSLSLSPSPRNVAGGIAALVKPGKKRGSVATSDLHVQWSLTQASRNQERDPTSLVGAIDMLRSALAAAKLGTSTSPDLAIMRQVQQGTRRVFVHADSFVELAAALDLAKEFGFEPVLVGAREADKVLARLVAQKAAVVLDTLQPEGRLADLTLPARLAQAGVPFAFAGAPERLRLSAALAVRHGLDRKTALAALTRTPARLLEQQATVGALRQGNAADFLVFRGDALDLGAAHVATWVDGVLLHGDLPKKANAAPSTTATGAL